MSDAVPLKRKRGDVDKKEQFPSSPSPSPSLSRENKGITSSMASRGSARFKVKRVKEKIPNVYSSSNLEVLSGGQIKFTKGRGSKYDMVKVDNSVVPKLKPEFEAMGIYKQPTGILQAHYKSPDEILTEDYKFEANELVYLSRQEIKGYTKIELPDEDISNVIHYYVAHRIRSRLGISEEEYDNEFCRFLDGSALLALSSLVTKWVEDCCGESSFKAHMEKVIEKESEKLSSIDEFIRVYDEDEEDEDTDEEDEEKNESENESRRQKRNGKGFKFGRTEILRSCSNSDSSSDDSNSLSEDFKPIRITKTTERS
ncbi:hypothetical protein PMKS-002638 [Pichia membranifaciens]|uniref:Uncharacterized protein n=1 Tax=Pichia membranifaciens TaxID=4926 RepID=A0A1Q2YHY8_9ASCO|nr:hypothetical protein PMKS-002638 [Pichia membranifaciens]